MCLSSFQTRLTEPVNEDLLSQRGLNGFMHSDDVYGGGSSGGEPNYMDPNAFVSDVSVQVQGMALFVDSKIADVPLCPPFYYIGSVRLPSPEE